MSFVRVCVCSSIFFNYLFWLSGFILFPGAVELFLFLKLRNKSSFWKYLLLLNEQLKVFGVGVSASTCRSKVCSVAGK